jgi:hypothetical protein
VTGVRKRDGNHSPHKNNLIQDSEGNEENRYPIPDSNKTKIIMTRKSTMPRRTPSKMKSASNH